MITFENLKVCKNTSKILSHFSNKIDFVFQPIFDRKNEIIGHEALMRPSDMNISDLIKKCMEDNTLHNLELATFFGATIAYKQRKYEKKLAINSFPSECFTKEEAKEYSENFRSIKEKMVIEILEYMNSNKEVWDAKKKHVENYKGIEFSLDDFGTGFNGLGSVAYFNPRTVKLDRSLISGINLDEVKQKNFAKFEKLFHDEGRLVLAEGIETLEEYNYLLNHGADLFQGYFLGYPE